MSTPSQDTELPTVELTLGGKVYSLRWGLRAILALKRHWKLADQRDVQAKIAAEQGDLETMIDIVWAAMQSHHRDMTPDDVLTLLDSQPLEAIAEKLQQAIEAATPASGPQKG